MGFKRDGKQPRAIGSIVKTSWGRRTIFFKGVVYMFRSPDYCCLYFGNTLLKRAETERVSWKRGKKSRIPS